MISPSDRNFDDLAHRFKRNIYDRLKGKIRLAVLLRDLEEHLPALFTQQTAMPLHSISTSSQHGGTAPSVLRILDAGGGQGQLALELGRLGHRVTLCDISSNMLSLAGAQFADAGVEATFLHQSIQDHCAANPAAYDLILCHAVLEWVANPEALLQGLRGALATGGHLSLSYYNVNGMVMKNLLRTNFSKVLKEDYTGYRGSLTPTWPRKTEEVMAWLAPLGLALRCHSGIRCFHDYILDPEQRNNSPDDQLALELKLSKQEPFRSLGRYTHLLLAVAEDVGNSAS